MSEFTCTKRSDDGFFCYFCLKAGADRSRVRGTNKGRINSFTVQYLLSITSPKGEKLAERENYMDWIYLLCVQVEILRDRTCSRVEAMLSFSGCVLSSGRVTIITETRCGGSDSDKRSQSPQTMMVGSYYQYSREKGEERICEMGADSGSIRWPATSVHTYVSF